jgi:hypothetical protein
MISGRLYGFNVHEHFAADAAGLEPGSWFSMLTILREIKKIGEITARVLNGSEYEENNIPI